MSEYKGLGDVVADFTKTTGLDKVAKKVAQLAGKEDCGCEKRRNYLNKKVPFQSPPSLLSPPTTKKNQ